MITVEKKSFNQITMKAKGTDETGRKIDLELTWAWAPELSAYNLTDRCWLTKTEWQFDELLGANDDRYRRIANLNDEEIHEALCDIDENARGLSGWESDFIESMVYVGSDFTPKQREKVLELLEKHWRG